MQQRLDAGLLKSMSKSMTRRPALKGILPAGKLPKVSAAGGLPQHGLRLPELRNRVLSAIHFCQRDAGRHAVRPVMGELNSCCRCRRQSDNWGFGQARIANPGRKRPEFLHQEPKLQNVIFQKPDRRRKPNRGAAQPGRDLVWLCGAAGPAGDPVDQGLTRRSAKTRPHWKKWMRRFRCWTRARPYRTRPSVICSNCWRARIAWWICRKATRLRGTIRWSPAVWGFIAGMTSATPLSPCIRKRWIRCCSLPSPCTSPPGFARQRQRCEHSYEALKAYQMSSISRSTTTANSCIRG